MFEILAESLLQTVQKPSKLSIGQPHPDPIVETASLSAVQPPEPTYDLLIAEEMEKSGALSCLQLETIVYASQVTPHFGTVCKLLFMNMF